MLLHHMSSQLEGVEGGEPAAVAHGVALLLLLDDPEHGPGRGTLPPVLAVPVLPQPRAGEGRYNNLHLESSLKLALIREYTRRQFSWVKTSH